MENTEKITENETPKQTETDILKRRPLWKIVLTSPLLAIIPITVFFMFFSDNNYLNNTENYEEISDLQAEIKMNIDSANYYEAKAAALSTNKESLEKIAREQYGMKRDNEEVYITSIK